MTSVKNIAALACAAAGLCSHAMASERTVPLPEPGIEKTLDDIAEANGIDTAGFGIIQDGELVWTHYYGEQSPGIPADSETRFNVASITKTVIAETTMRLAAQGKFDLDEPLAAYWVDPDIADDPRNETITARGVLTHSTGLPNWRAQHGGTLFFQHEPGTTYGYSGEGFEYLARALENKFGKSLPDIVEEIVFDPIGMTDVSLTAHPETPGNIAMPFDENGKSPGYYCGPWLCREEGEYSAADDMTVSVPAYAKFMISVMREEGYSSSLAEQRNRIETEVPPGYGAIHCGQYPERECPQDQGYGLGFAVVSYDDDVLLGHGGWDSYEIATAYFYDKAEDGLIIFLNAPNHLAVQAMPDLIAAIDEDFPLYARYHRFRRMRNEE